MQALAVEQSFAMGGIEPKEAQDSQIVLANARRGVADEANAPPFDIGESARVIVNLPVGGQRQRVDREVAPLGVLLEVAAKAHLGEAPVGLDVLAQRRDFVGRARDDDRHGAVLDARRHALETGVSRSRKDVLGQRRRRKIDLVGRQAEQGVAHGAADDAGLGAGLGERRKDRRQPWIVKNSLRCVHSKRPGFNFPFSTWAGT